MNQALAKQHELRAATGSLRILLAEGDGELRRLLSQALERDGHQVVSVRDGGALLEELAATIVERTRPQFDLVICEQGLPGIQGMTVLSGLRARDNEIRFVLICADPVMQERARRLGGVVLDQPVDAEAVRGAVRLATFAGGESKQGSEPTF
ncbi:MAG TPA: response regulator [Polyangia bacterium]|nr:response regulator [Polyangia bacterium]